MTDFSGTCSSKLQSQTMASVPSSSDHQMGLSVMLGQHKSTEQRWNDAKMTYVGSTDLVDGKANSVAISITHTRMEIRATGRSMPKSQQARTLP